CSLFFLFFSIIFITCFYFTTFIEKSPAKAELFRQADRKRKSSGFFMAFIKQSKKIGREII
ncbi:hypothetical protein B5F08_01180, partial [Anaeromassilibacillus sp. An172]|uniref:hypothetical protein n=1 Tax=Anaeromassilibacillus sp. An172 TaxID=1965570 RepID=UPI000B54B754